MNQEKLRIDTKTPKLGALTAYNDKLIKVRLQEVVGESPHLIERSILCIINVRVLTTSSASAKSSRLLRIKCDS
jgi:hypothetical protein